MPPGPADPARSPPPERSPATFVVDTQAGPTRGGVSSMRVIARPRASCARLCSRFITQESEKSGSPGLKSRLCEFVEVPGPVLADAHEMRGPEDSDVVTDRALGDIEAFEECGAGDLTLLRHHLDHLKSSGVRECTEHLDLVVRILCRSGRSPSTMPASRRRSPLPMSGSTLLEPYATAPDCQGVLGELPLDCPRQEHPRDLGGSVQRESLDASRPDQEKVTRRWRPPRSPRSARSPTTDVLVAARRRRERRPGGPPTDSPTRRDPRAMPGRA